MAAFWTRKKMARKLGVTPQRVHQMQASGVLVSPERDADGDVEGWPETYAEAFVGRRLGRRVSQSVFGLSPSTVPAELVDDTVLRLRSSDDCTIFAMRLQHPEASVVFLQPLAFEPEPVFAGAAPSGTARSVRTDDEEIRLAVRRSADLWFDGDVTQAAFVLVTERYGSASFWDIVVTDDPTAVEQQRVAPHWLEVGSHEQLPLVDAGTVTAAVLRDRLGRPVPAFLPDQLTPSVLERWQANGRQPVVIVRDYGANDRAVVAAMMIDALEPVPEATRAAMVSAVLEGVRWEDSGAAPSELTPNMAAGLADWDDDPAAVAQQLVLQLPEFASRASAAGLRDRPMTVPLTPSAFTKIANDTQRLLFDLYGVHGKQPAPRVVSALELGLDALFRQTQTAAYRAGDYTGTADLSPRGVAPFSFRSWSDQAFHPVSIAFENSLTTPVRADDAAFRAISAELLRQAEISVDAEQLRGLRVELFRDVAGVHVGRLRAKDRTYYCVAVPVLPEGAEAAGIVRSFANIVVEPDSQMRPVLLDTSAGPTVMPFGRPFSGGFTHGYSGHGPSNLQTSIIAFLERAGGRPVPDPTAELVRAAVHGAAQDEPLVIPRGLLALGA
jgi:hypothetical protein